MAEVILPGTYITVRDEGLISVGGVVTGNIGIVGTAAKGPVNTVQILGSFTEAREIFGDADPWQGGTQNELTLVRALELVYNNGGRTVYAVRTASDAARAATYGVADDDGTGIAQLTARSPGRWGNEITFAVSGEQAPKQVELRCGAIQETYTVTDANDLVTQLNRGSTLVTAALPAQAGAAPEGPRRQRGAREEAAPSAPSGAAPIPRNTLNAASQPAAQSFEGGHSGENATAESYGTSLALLENELVNIVLLAGQEVANKDLVAVLQSHLNTTAQIKRERLGLIGSSGSVDIKDITDNVPTDDAGRLIYTAPGLQTGAGTLPGGYTAAAVAGLIASLPVQTSPTNKTLTLPGLAVNFNASYLENLVGNRVLAVERRNGYRVVKGITTATNPAWHQITTRRIVDYAIYGVRAGCDPYIGKLNNTRVRAAMKATLDGFLTRMVESEALVGYTLAVSATRAQEIAGRCIVTMTVQPTFSIDFIMVTMYLG